MSNMQVIKEILPDVFLLKCFFHEDKRGSFTKLFHHNALLDQGINFLPLESYISSSSLNVLRGMHYQEGKAAHQKLVFCSTGKILDVIVDIRTDSSNFNKPISIELNEKKSEAILIGKGYAHGFLSLEKNSSMIYYTSTVHNPDKDTGIHWSSINFEWPCKKPLISLRDSNLPSIQSLI